MDLENTHLPSVCYEIFVRSFCDSNHDGIGDLNGITSKLDYLQDLGIEAIWLSPIFKSHSYHKYDVVDYWSIDLEFGTLDDFIELIGLAHIKGIKVFLDFVINHTSKNHPWFIEAKQGSENSFRNYYNWLSKSDIKARGIAIREITGDSSEANPWHLANIGDTEKYYGMFWSGMPDLNMDNHLLRNEMYKIGKYWLELGVDGFRMDAAKHIYPDWESEKCHHFWEEFRQKMEEVNPNVYIVGEVWTSAENIAPFFKGLKANFNFDLCFAIQDIVKTGKDNKEIIKMLIKNYAIFDKVNPNFIDATMLGNHDINRIGSVADGNIEKLKMAANLLLLLPGNPYLYYGEEIGMLGSKPDENLREAFLWDARFVDKYRTNWRKPKYNTDSKVSPLKIQKLNIDSLFNHYKTLISLRKSFRGLNQILNPNLIASETSKKGIVSFIRPYQNEDILILQNITYKTIDIKIEEEFESILLQTNLLSLSKKSIAKLNSYGILVLRLKNA